MEYAGTVAMVVATIGFVVTFVWALRHMAARRAQSTGLREQAAIYQQTHPEAKGLVSYESAEFYDDGLWQVYGDVVGVILKPGMRLVLPDKRVVSIHEVYVNNATPDQPAPEARPGEIQAAIMLSIPDVTDSKYFEQFYAQNPIIFIEAEGADTLPLASTPAGAIQPAFVATAQPAQMNAGLRFFIAFAVFAVMMVGSLVAQNSVSDNEAESPAPTPAVTVNTNMVDVTASLGDGTIALRLPEGMKQLSQTDSLLAYGLLADGSVTEYAGRIEVRTYALDSAEFTGLQSALKDETYQKLFPDKLQSYCTEPLMSTEVRTAALTGATAAEQTAFKCPEKSDGTDTGGYVVIATTDTMGYVVVMTAQRAVWESNESVWDSIVPSIELKRAQSS